MHKCAVMGVCLTLLLSLAAGPVLAQATTRPAGKSLLEQTYDLAAEARTWAKWACILVGLALLGVLWGLWSLQTLARNQVQLGRMIQSQKQQ